MLNDCHTDDTHLLPFFFSQVIVAMSQQYKLEEFSESDLLVNITRHILVPKHEVLSPEEKKALLER